MLEIRTAIRSALNSFSSINLVDSAVDLLHILGYRSDKIADFGAIPSDFINTLEDASPDEGKINREKLKVDAWDKCAFLFQLTNDEIPSLAAGQQVPTADRKVNRKLIESFVFLAIELSGEEWSRTALATITRELNKRFPMPAIILFKHGRLISMAVIDRRVSLRDPNRDVIESRITVIKDVRCENPHRAHVDILAGLAIDRVGEKKRPTNFRELYDAWIAALSIQALNRRFYTQLFWWYLYAVRHVHFPIGGGTDESNRNSLAVIRLLTRLIFVWFIKEKGLVPDALFDSFSLRQILDVDPAANPDESNYYLAILQNLFFATLNVEMGDDEQGRTMRRWASESKTGGQSGHYLIHSVYRHKGAFRNPDAARNMFLSIPFLNGGLFECLDRELSEKDFQRTPDLKKRSMKEGKGWVLRIDGFSRRKEAQPVVPNKLFFGGEPMADLNADLATKGKTYEVLGLLDIFSLYKFTVDENTPLEEEVALDPELLGKVFENLLASYNDDTKTTARRQTGSFYTPREVVDYMVDEALSAYLEEQLLSVEPVRLRRLLSYADTVHDFSSDEIDNIIKAIESLRLLDPACGSGAFPMGALQKLVHVLRKLDPENKSWRSQNRTPLEAQLKAAHTIPDAALREEKVEEAEAALTKFDRDFSDANYPDYTRKLYLIEKCIHGVDIQPIAVQIAKLRFFISLIVSQRVDVAKFNLNITALPNLETKIVAADSLMPIDRPTQMGLRDLAIDDTEKALIEGNEHYFAARTGKTKRKWRDKIFVLRDELANLLEKDLFLSPGAARQLVHWDPFDQNAAADFFDPEWMFQISDGFDIVIGNPPYVNAGAIRQIKPQLREVYGKFFDGNADLFTYFYRRGFDLLTLGGVLTYISSNKFMRTGYGEKTRRLLSREGELRSVIDFGELPVFGASVDSAIVVVQKPTGFAQSNTFRAVAIKQKEEIPIAGQMLNERGENYKASDLPDSGWLFESSSTHHLLEQIKSSGKRLDDIVQGRFFRGILTGLNDAFVITEVQRDGLLSDQPNLDQIIKPWLDGDEILRWRTSFSGQYVIAIASSTNRQWPWSEAKTDAEAEKAFYRTYPPLKNHFSKFLDRLRRRTDQGQYWWELRSCSYWDAFDQSKLVFNETSKELHAFIDDNNLCINKTGFIIVHEDRHYLLGVMNSTVLDYYYRHTFPCWGNPWKGGRIQFRRDRMVDIPIPWPDNSVRDSIAGCVKVVGSIYTSTAGTVAGTPATRFEQLINALVYEIFFPEDLHKSGLRFFEEAVKAGVAKLATLNGKALEDAADKLAGSLFTPTHSLYSMLFDLQALDVVRIIERRE